MVQWVGQKHTKGCGIACLAMLTGHDYDAVASYYPVDLNVTGLYMAGVDDYLVDHGFAVARKLQFMSYFTGEHGRREREPWPPEPFAEQHLVQVRVYEKAPIDHFVVLLADGTVLDPLTPEPRRLSDYFRIYSVAAVVACPGARP